jgi:hypothetical protein
MAKRRGGSLAAVPFGKFDTPSGYDRRDESAVGQLGALRLNELRKLDILHENRISFSSR